MGSTWVWFFPNAVELALPPLFFFYVTCLIQANFKFKKKDWLHFLPFFISQTYSIIVYILTLQTPIYHEKEVIDTALYFDEIKTLDEYVAIMLITYYVYLSIQRKYLADKTHPEIYFIRKLSVGLIFLTLWVLVNLVLNHVLTEPHPWRWKLSHLIIATLVYYMGLVGYKNSDILPQPTTPKVTKNKAKPAQDFSNLDLEIITKIQQAINVDKLYLNPKLSLQDLSKHIHVGENALSQTINVYYQKNFRSFINEVRVEEVKKCLLNEEMGNLSLLGIAKECGFNSEASFYRIFRATTGQTPKQFLATHTPV